MTRDTFFNLPAAKQTDHGQVGLVGVPFDGLSTERRGSCEGPQVLRRFSRQVGGYGVLDGTSRQRGRARAVDLGDVALNRFMGEGSFGPIHDRVARVVQTGATPLVVGGEHSLTYGAVHGLVQGATRSPDPSRTQDRRGGEPVRLVQIDAHHDATDPAEHGCGFNHGTWVRNLIEDGVVRGPDVFQIGVRDFQWSDSGAGFLARHHAKVFPLGEAGTDGFEPFFTALQRQAHQPTWISLDIDSVDPAFAPGVGETMVGGLTSREILSLTRRLFNGQINIVGADLVELVPVMDLGERTCALAAQLLAVMFDGLTSVGPL